MDLLQDILQLVFFCLVTYITVIFIIRISGKRTLSKLNSFDFIITVCLGSIMATTVTDPSLPITRGLTAFATLVFFQYLISKLTTHWKPAQKVILFKPALLYYEGQYIDETLKKERISKQEILEAMRQSGFEDLENVKAVVLETEGSISIIPYSDNKEPHTSSLKDIK